MNDKPRLDVIETLSQLPNDEVFTTPKVAREMLSLLPEELWTNPYLKWLDPFSKSGVFLREVGEKLMQSLTDWEPDESKRRQHILKSMLHAYAISELTGLITRRTLYQSMDATGAGVIDDTVKPILVKFENTDGNVKYARSEHVLHGKSKACKYCKAQKSVFGDDRENFAYPFLHGTLPEEDNNMKFDVILGNPPYQIGMKDEKGEVTKNITPLYNLFVEKAIDMNPDYVLMITPSRWFSGGKGLDGFRKRMLDDRRIRKIVDYPNAKELFPNVEIKGGVSYFLWQADYEGNCLFRQVYEGKVLGEKTRDLRDGQGVLVRSLIGEEITRKVIEHPSFKSALSEVVSKRDPFGQNLTSNYAYAKDQKFTNSVPLIFNNKIGYVSKSEITRNFDWVSQFKVLLPKAYGGTESQKGLSVLGQPIALDAGSACTQSYLVAGRFGNKDETRNYARYLTTKFVRFLALQRKTSQNITSDVFRFVPVLDMKKEWEDQELYKLFGLAESEINHIEESIVKREFIDSLDSPIPKTHLPGGIKFNTPAVDEDEDD